MTGSTHDGRMACLPCRQSKHKCDGDTPKELADLAPGALENSPQNYVLRTGAEACTRCRNNGSKCVWAPRAKLGRPSKRRREDASEDSSSTTPPIPDGSLMDSLWGLMQPDQPADHPDQTPPVANTVVDDTTLSDYLFDVTAFTPGSSSSSSSAVPSNPFMEWTSAHALTMPFTYIRSFFPAVSSQSRLLERVQHWAVAPGITKDTSIFPLEAFALYTLCQNIVAMGSRVAEGASCPAHREDLLAAARQGTEDLLDRLSKLDSVFSFSPRELLHITQALLLSVFLHFGLGDVPLAKRCADTAINRALSSRLHELDMPRDALNQMLLIGKMSVHAGLPELQGDPALCSDLRLAWWEISVVDTILAVSTAADVSTCVLRSAMSTNVRFPEIDGKDFSTAIELRVRSAAIMAECVQGGQQQDAFKWLRLEALSTMISNLTSEARHRWTQACAPNIRGIALMAFIMLHAARIQILRQTFVPELSFDLQACSFRTKAPDPIFEELFSDLTSASQASNLADFQNTVATCSVPPKQITLQEATSLMVESASEMMDILRNDAGSEAFAARATPLAKHSPFICCSQVAAAFGFAFAAAALQRELESNNGEPYQPHTSVQKSLLKQEAAIWRHRAILSNLSAAQFNLEAINRLWPVTAQMATEVDACKRFVATTGPVGLLG